MRKRLLTEALEVITDKPNGLTLFYFVFAHLPQKEAEILTTQMKSMNFENKTTEELRLSMLSILAKKFTL